MTVPSGMWTWRSMMARRMRQCRPMFTCEKTMLASTVEYEFTRTSCDSTEFETVAPEMMTPAVITESTAMPERPGSAKTNLAGGYWRTRVRLGQFLSYRLKTGETAHRSILAS